MIRYIFIILFLFLISSCGLRPLSDFEKDNTKLTEISLGDISGRERSLIKNSLLNAFNIYNIDVTPQYTLDVKIISTITDAIIQKDSTILEKRIILNATYILKDISTNKIINQDSTSVQSSFASTVSPYGSFMQEQKAYENAIKYIVNNIKRKLVIFFAKQEQQKNENSK